MTDENSRSWLESMFGPPAISLTTVRWVAETEETDEDGDTYVSETPMFDVVGEQHRPESVSAAAQAITGEGSFLPARFWLVCDNANAHDSSAVRVHAVVGDNTYHVGFLNRNHAKIFRGSMQSLGLPERTLEVLGCIAQGKTAPHPNARLYLPIDFSDLLRAGYAEKLENNPNWLQDPSAVAPRPWRGSNAAGFSDGELCKIYCRYAKQMMWNSLPHKCEEAAGRLRGFGAMVPMEMEAFVLDPEEPAKDSSDWQDGDHYEDAKDFLKQFIRTHLEKVAPGEDVKARFKHTQVGGKRGQPGCLSFLMYWSRTHAPIKNLGTFELTRTGPGASDFKVTRAEFNS